MNVPEDLAASNPSAYIRQHIRTVPDWPAPGVMFRDITPLLANPRVFRVLIDQFVHRYFDVRPDVIAGLDARGDIVVKPRQRRGLAMHGADRPDAADALQDREAFGARRRGGGRSRHRRKDTQKSETPPVARRGSYRLRNAFAFTPP